MIEKLKAVNKKVIYAAVGGLILLGFGLTLALSPYLQSMLGMSGLQPGHQEAQRFHGFVFDHLSRHVNEVALQAHSGQNVFDQDMTDEQKIDQARRLANITGFDGTVDVPVFEYILVRNFGFDQGRVASLTNPPPALDMNDIVYTDTLEMWDTYVEEGNRIVIFRLNQIQGFNSSGEVAINVQNLNYKYFRLTLDSNEQLIRNVVLLSNYTGRTLFGDNVVQPEVIERSEPVVTVSFSDPTSEGVTVTLVADREIAAPEGWTQAGLTSFTRKFTENVTKDLIITDLAGNTTTVVINVNSIGTNQDAATVPEEDEVPEGTEEE